MEDWLQCQISHVDKKSQNPNANPTVDTFFSCSMAVLMRNLPFSAVLWQFWWDIYLFQLFYGSSDEIFTFFSCSMAALMRFFTFFSCSMAVLMRYILFSAVPWQFWWDIYLFQLFYGSSDEIFTFFSCSMAVLMRYLPFFQLFYGSSDEIFTFFSCSMAVLMRYLAVFCSPQDQ